MFTELDANNCYTIIAQDLSNSVVNSANFLDCIFLFGVKRYLTFRFYPLKMLWSLCDLLK